MKSADQKKTVLLVDDTPANIRIANSILKELYTIRVATNGAKALELARVTPMPDLILLDVMMPEMDGYEVCTQLKLSPDTRDIPVIFLTGQTDVEDETRGFGVGAVDYIHKPFSPAVVQARVQTHLLLRGIREQLATQLRTIQKELDTARQIQLSILPSEIPKLSGLDIAARYVPMSSVAGDFYDFVVVDEKHIGILIADVSGHGMPAALIASMLKIALAAQVAHASDPAQVLLGLNQALCGKFEHHFITAAYLFLDMHKRSLTYAGAGHPPLLVWGESSKGVREVLENGLFLGMFSLATYSSIELPLRPGDRLLLYTDGIPETTNPSGVEFGAAGFKQFLETEQSVSADHFSARLLEELSRWSDRGSVEDLNDDITIVAIYIQDD
jgi:sigma-B regulation protein RsbU (phosphoserine phosphatase)